MLLPCASASAEEPVDVELVLAVDVSLSMSPMELDIQRRGYIAALTDERVIQAIRDGLHGKIALTYFEWAGDSTQRVVVPWTVIASEADARAFAARLEGELPIGARRTSISGALRFAADLFAESGFRATKRVVDISGDGPNNQGEPVLPVRDELTAQGIAINGLPLMTRGGYGYGRYDMAELDVYYENCVIGGAGAFMIPVNDWSQFPEAIRRKLVLELAGDATPKARYAAFDGFAPPVWRVQSPRDALYDCEIGEKMWDNNRWMWDSR